MCVHTLRARILEITSWPTPNSRAITPCFLVSARILKTSSLVNLAQGFFSPRLVLPSFLASAMFPFLVSHRRFSSVLFVRLLSLWQASNDFGISPTKAIRTSL